MTVPPADATARLVAQVRVGLRMTQREFAATAGVPVTTVSGWETGAYSPTVERLAEVFSAVGVPLTLSVQLPSHPVTVTVDTNRPDGTGQLMEGRDDR